MLPRAADSLTQGAVRSTGEGVLADRGDDEAVREDVPPDGFLPACHTAKRPGGHQVAFAGGLSVHQPRQCMPELAVLI